MNFCRPECVGELTQPEWGISCDTAKKPGGISRLIFVVCDNNYTLKYPEKGWGDLDNIKQAICDKKLYFSPAIMGQKPKGSFTKKRLSSCGEEEVVSGTKTITFTDYTNENSAEYDFWNNIFKKQRFLKVGWATCDDKMYLVESSFGFEIDEVADEDKQGDRKLEGEITFSGTDLIKPYDVDGLNSFFAGYKHDYCYYTPEQ